MAFPPSDNKLPPPDSLPPTPPKEDKQASGASAVRKSKDSSPDKTAKLPIQPKAKGDAAAARIQATHLARIPPGAVKLPSLPADMLRQAEKADELGQVSAPAAGASGPKIGRGRINPPPSPQEKGKSMESTGNEGIGSGAQKQQPLGRPPGQPRIFPVPSPAENELLRVKAQSQAFGVEKVAGASIIQGQEELVRGELPIEVALLTSIVDLEGEFEQGVSRLDRAKAAAYKMFSTKQLPRTQAEYEVMAKNLHNIAGKMRSPEFEKFIELKNRYLRTKSLQDIQMPCTPQADDSPKIARIKQTANLLHLMCLYQEEVVEVPQGKSLGDLGIIHPKDFVLGYKSLGIQTEDFLEAVRLLLTREDYKNPLIARHLLALVDSWVNSNLYNKELGSHENSLQGICNMCLDILPDASSNIIKGVGFRQAIARAERLPQAKPTAGPLNPLVNIFKTAPQELAHELGTVFTELYARAPILELYDINKKAEERQALAPNLCKLIDTFNNLSSWVSKEIVSKGNLRDAEKARQFFKAALQQCIDQGNLLAAFSIYTGLSSASVNRLFEPDAQDKEFDALFDAGGNYNALRERQAKLASKFCIPCIHLFSKDFQFAGENPSSLRGMLNANKAILHAKILDTYQKQTDSMLKQLSTREHILDLGNILSKKYDDKELDKDSLKLKPRGG